MTLLISLTLKMTVLTLLALAASIALGRRSAAVRHWLLATTLVCCLCLPALELLAPGWTIPLPSFWSASATTDAITITSTPAATAGAYAAASDTVRPSSSSRLPPIATLLVSMWLAGVVAGVGVLLVGLWRLRALASQSDVVSSGPWREAAEDVARIYDVRRPIRILDCHHPTMLATWGVQRPTILLPAGAAAWSVERIRAVLYHELAHIGRHDWIVTLLATLLRAVYWFNPLLWIACRRLRLESERACDDLVLASGMSGEEYATHLLDVAREARSRHHNWSPAIAVAHRSMLEGRVRAMLNVRVNRQPVTAFARAATVAAIAVVTASIGTAGIAGSTSSTGVVVPPVVQPAPTSSGILPVRPAGTGSAPQPQPARAETQAAQPEGGRIEGVLYDPFGGLLPGVSVKLTGVGSSGSRNTSTDRGGAFAFTGLAAGDYEIVTDLPGFTAVRNVIHADPGAPARRYITLPIGTVRETILVTCASADLVASRPGAPTGSSTPGPAERAATPGRVPIEPKIPSTFTGGIGGQIKAPTKLSHTNPVCPTVGTPQSTVVTLAGRIGIDGQFSDLHDVSGDAQPAYVASALEAARKWVFTPTLLNGAPIEANISVTVRYSWSN